MRALLVIGAALLAGLVTPAFAAGGNDWDYAAMKEECARLSRAGHCAQLVNAIEYRMDILRIYLAHERQAEDTGDEISAGLSRRMSGDESPFIEHDINWLSSAFPEVWAKR